MPDNLKPAIEHANKVVAKWPKWKRNILTQNGKPTVDTPRTPIVNHELMTPKQRDELATIVEEMWYCRACKSVWNKSQLFLDPMITENRWTCSNLMCGGNCRQIKTLDDCRLLLEEIERRGLWGMFAKHVMKITEWPYPFPGRKEAIRYALFQVTPADIVAAFIKTIEEADGKYLVRD